MPAASLDGAVHGHCPALNADLGFAAARRCAGQLEEGTQRQRPPDADVVQLLRRIGMIR